MFKVKEKSIFDAHELYLSGKYDKALSVCEQILARNTESYSALNIIANIYLIKGDTEKGIQYLFKLKDFFLKRKEYDKAVAVMERVLDVRPEDISCIKQIAEIYDRSGRESLSIHQQLKAAEILRYNGDFKACAGIYAELTAMYPHLPELIRKCVNSLTMIGAYDKLFRVLKSKVFPSGNFSREEKDDFVVLCAENGADVSIFTDQIDEFLKGGADRLKFLENPLIKHFTDKRDDTLFNSIENITGRDALAEVIKIVSLNSPENIPEPVAEVAPEKEPEIPSPVVQELPAEEEVTTDTQAFELESHVQTVEEVTVPALELDSFDTAETVTETAELSGLETFSNAAEPVETVSAEGLESHSFHQENEETSAEPVFEDAPQDTETDMFASFETEGQSADKDIFSAFDTDPAPEPQPEKEDVKQIDMSDVQVEKNDEDMFAGLVEETQQQKPEKKPEKKIDISADEIKPAEEGKDIFDMEV